MNVVVLLKQVPDTESIIEIAGDGVSIKTDDVKWVVNPYDELAVEEALQIVESAGSGQVTVLCAGSKRSEKSLRSALAMGAHPYKVCQLHWHGVDMKPLMEKMGIDHEAAWVEFEEQAARIESGEIDFMSWEDC